MTETKTYRIYKYTNIINGKSYIGHTSMSLKDRADSNGCSYLKTTKHFGPAIKEYGWSNFKGEVLLEVHTKKNAAFAEGLMTVVHNTQWSNGYNEKIGCKNSERMRERMSKNHANVSGSNNPNYGKHHTAHNKGKHCYTNGVTHKYAYECPEGFWKA